MKTTKKRILKTSCKVITAITVTSSMLLNMGVLAHAEKVSEITCAEKLITLGEEVSANENFISMDEEGNIELIPVEKLEVPDYEELEALDQAEYLVLSEIGGKEKIVEVMSTLEEAEQYIEEIKEAEEVASNEQASIGFWDDLTPSITAMAAKDDLTASDLKTSKTYSSTDSNSIVVFISSSSTIGYTNAETGAAGYISASYGPDAAYLGMQDGKVKFKQSGVIGLVDADKVNVVSYEDYVASKLVTSVYTTSNGNLYHKITTSLTEYASTIIVGYQQSYMTNDATYYSYDGHYFYKDYSKMVKDYQAGTYKNSINASKPYYNYYQFLSHRTETKYTAEELDAYIDYRTKSYSSSKMTDTGECFIEYQDKYGSNALLMMGVAMNESAYGTSNIANTKNNLFGHAAYDTNTDSASGYSSVSESIKYHAETFISLNYANPKNWKYYGAQLGDKQSGMNVKYASDPYWGEKAAAHGYHMENYAKTTSSVKSSDYNTYDMGMADGILSVYKEPNSSVRFYTTENSDGYDPLDIGVIILGEQKVDGVLWYKIQSDIMIKSDRSNYTTSTGEYDYGVSYGYVKASAIDVLSDYSSGGSNEGELEEPEVKPEYTLGDVSGDGKITSLDYVKVKNHIMGTSVLKGNYLLAADTSGDGKVTSLDYVQIKNHIMGISTIG